MTSVAVQRRAPSQGYDFDAKAEYRRMVWKHLAKEIKNVRTAHIALMPSIEGLELEYVIKLGFQRENIHVIDDNPAIVATLQRNPKFAGFKPQGVPVDEALRRISKAGIRLSAVNIDLTGQASESMHKLLASCWATKAIADGTRVAVTQLRGREIDAKDFFAIVSGVTRQFGIDKYFHNGTQCRQVTFNDMDSARVAFVGAALSGGRECGIDHPTSNLPDLIAVGAYKSHNGQSFLWSVFEAIQVRNAYNDIENEYISGNFDLTRLACDQARPPVSARYRYALAASKSRSLPKHIVRLARSDVANTRTLVWGIMRMLYMYFIGVVSASHIQQLFAWFMDNPVVGHTFQEIYRDFGIDQWIDVKA